MFEEEEEEEVVCCVVMVEMVAGLLVDVDDEVDELSVVV
jgi:hypothetical protein